MSNTQASDEAAQELHQQSVGLMERIARQDHSSEEAMKALIELHQHSVIGTAAKMLGGNLEDGHDIAQQVFIRIWKAAPRYQPKAKFTTWMFTITRNLVFNETRKRKVRKELSSEQLEEEHHQLIADQNTPTPSESTLQQELEENVKKAIESLPEKQRMAVVLRKYQDMPYEEIGEVLKLSLPAVKSLLFRARAQLKESLKAYLEQA